MIHTVKDFSVVNEAEVDVFLAFSCFFYYPTDVANLISGSSAFSKTRLNIREFMVHILLKPGLENVEHELARINVLPTSSLRVQECGEARYVLL